MSNQTKKTEKKRSHKQLIDEEDENKKSIETIKSPSKKTKKDQVEDEKKVISKTEEKQKEKQKQKIQKKRLETIKIQSKSNIDMNLPNGGNVKFFPKFLSKEEGDKLYKHLFDSIEWVQGEYNMYGKTVKTPRLLWAMRDTLSEISDSYSVTGSSIWTDEIKSLRDKISKHLNTPITYAQMNYYRTGNDYIGWHSDRECQNGDIIASISLGQSRKFCFRNKEYKTDKSIPKYEFELNHGDLIVMDNDSGNKKWKHCVPKQKDVSEGRINITFRVK